MAPLLGKTKRRNKVLKSTVDAGIARQDEDTENLHNLLRQHFETTFEPLQGLSPIMGKVEETKAHTSDNQSDSEWDGCSDGEVEAVEVVHHSTMPSSKTEVPRDEVSTFMTAKPPSSTSKQATATSKKPPESAGEEASTDAANLKKDLALQRLLKESHLLDSASSLSHVGQNRHKALDLRLQDMGSKSSIFMQQKMPLAQRKGIKAKSAEREELRRRQAQENGIILEKASKSRSKESSSRQRGIGAPGVGKFHGGMLKLSKKDVADIEGPKKNFSARR